MSNQDFVRQLPQSAGLGASASARLVRIHLDPTLLVTLMGIIGFGLVVLYSASGGRPGGEIPSIFTSQFLRMGLALIAMLVAAQLHPRLYQRWAPIIYVGGIALLVLVLLVGVKVKGSYRWLDLPGLPRFQPSELMKLGVPMMLAWYFADRALPPRFKDLCAALLIIAIPTALIILQPDLGTGILIAGAGLSLIVLAGIYWRWIGYAFIAMAATAPGLWFVLQDYQRKRILTLFDPESDPLGAGWNTMQATTAIGSGGLYGKGLFEGTQSHLEFLPEAQTDFIIAVIGEEFGFVGVLALLSLYLIVVARGLYIATQTQYTFQRLLAGTLTLTFFVYVFVNIAMVSGLLPVVGVPLPLVSYGGTSAITLMASFGIIMGVRTHRAW